MGYFATSEKKIIAKIASKRSTPIMLYVIFVFFLLPSSEASFHIDKLELNFNETCNNTTITYYHDKKLNAAADVTIQTFVITNKMLLYLTVNIAENKHDKHLKREILKTVIDVNKLFKGFYGNPLIKGFMRDLAGRIDALNLKMPLPMVSLKISITYCFTFNKQTAFRALMA